MKRKFIDFQAIRRVSLDVILQFLNAEKDPLSKPSEKESWYYSPFRKEATPSFHVLRGANTWIDFGTGEKGTNIDLIIRLGIAPDCYLSARWIEEHFLNGAEGINTTTRLDPVILQPNERKEPRAKFMYVREIISRKLIDYFEVSRRIPRDILCYYCQEVHYGIDDCNDKYGAGIINVKGGYAVRSPWRKITVGNGGVSIFPGTAKGFLVFEGLTNMLSYATLKGVPSSSVIVMNSVANILDAIHMLDGGNEINCYLDNDDAGRRAINDIRKAYGEAVIDHAREYEGYNDLNAFLSNQ